jgi:(hydroxyamino)benzene mutase
MDAKSLLSRQGHRLLQFGIGLFVFSSLEGFAIPYFGSPRLGLSAHTLSGLQGVLALALGLMWPRLWLGANASRVAFWSFVYSDVAILGAYVIGAAWGAGNETMPLAAGSAQGTALEETVIRVVAYSSAPPGLTAFGLMMWGLRLGDQPRTPMSPWTRFASNDTPPAKTQSGTAQRRIELHITDAITEVLFEAAIGTQPHGWRVEAAPAPSKW